MLNDDGDMISDIFWWAVFDDLFHGKKIKSGGSEVFALRIYLFIRVAKLGFVYLVKWEY